MESEFSNLLNHDCFAPGATGKGGANLSKQGEGKCEAKECDGLLAMLQDDKLQSIAYLRLEGYRNLEIATKISKSVSTVERRLSEIRACWKSSLENANQDSLDGSVSISTN